jgi:putative endonuclease
MTIQVLHCPHCQDTNIVCHGKSPEEGALNWVVYMLECADKSLYTGITTNLERRLAEHAAGQGARYTKGRGPFRLVYSETCAGRAEATRRETAIKLMDKAKKRLLFS